MITSFTFTPKMIEAALEANGWRALWNHDNWVHESSKNPDWGGCSADEAFRQLLRSKNLT